MKKFLLLYFFATAAIGLSGQVNKFGVPFIKNYATQITQGSEQNWCITKDKFGNVYFGNQDKGVICYDGTKWSAIRIKNNPRIFSLRADERGIVYVGAAYEFGYLQPDKKGKAEYVSLAERIDSVAEIKFIYSIEILNDLVYFLGPKFIYIYDIKNDSLTEISLAKFNVFDAYKLARINDKLILTDNINGIFELRDTIISPLPGGGFFKKKLCTVLLPYDESKALICTFQDGLFLYDYKTGIVKDDFVDTRLNEKFRTVLIYAAAKISNDLFAIGTTSEEGILVFNRTGKLISQINKENCDLEDNTILAMYCDYPNNSELWISTTGVISKAYFNIPLTLFSEKQGIDYAVNDISEFQGNIYLSSDAGILKSYIDKNNCVSFKKIPGIDSQFFPLEVINSDHGEFLLAGGLEGILQISPNGIIRKVENICLYLPKKKGNFGYNTRCISQSSYNHNIVYIGLEVGGIIVLKNEGNHWQYLNKIKIPSGSVNWIVEQENHGLWLLTNNPDALFNISTNAKDTTVIKYGEKKGVPQAELHSLQKIKDETYITTSTGIYRYDKKNDRFVSDNTLTGGFSEGKYAVSLFMDEDSDIWFSGYDTKYYEMLFRNTSSGIRNYTGVLNLLPNIPRTDIMSSNGRIYLTKTKIVSVIEKARLLPDTTKVNTRFISITIGTDSVVMAGMFHKDIDEKRRIPELVNSSTIVPEYGYDMNRIIFAWTTSYFIEELQTEYSYKLEGYDKEWSKWAGISFGFTFEALYSKKDYTNLPHGHYTFRVRSRTLTGLEGNELKYEFIILKPWYTTIYAYIGFILTAFLVIFGIISAYTRRLKNENIRLEGIVAERTAIVVKQKEELESSIHYASRIQMALLPSEAILSENIRNYFVLLKPRDIVSGDFYWMTKKDNRLYIVAADCTGHGVPGAFMSLLGMSFLDEIIDKEKSPRADFILNQLRHHVTDSLKQVGGEDEAKDGMDIALLVIDFNSQRVEFSGAYNPCFRVRKLTEIEVIKYQSDSAEMPDGSMSDGKYLLETIYGSKMPIGISSRMNENFEFYDWRLEKGISYYLFSDGYIDQFGGPRGRKFMKKNFKKLILEIQIYPMKKQKEILEKRLMDWMGQTPQIDDILVMGIRTD
jgi:serine phosphatase RsbU (regulator of sigma subunit)/ligand-binding sensor domain-containing protein